MANSRNTCSPLISPSSSKQLGMVSLELPEKMKQLLHLMNWARRLLTK